MPIEIADARHLCDVALDVLRLRAIHGIESGYSQVELAKLLGVRNETISRWWIAYQADGIDSLPGNRTGGPQGSGRALDDARAKTIRDTLDASLPEELGLEHALWTRRAVGDLIRELFGIDLADRTVGTYLRRWGYTPKKPSPRGAKQDPDEVAHWLLGTYPAIEMRAENEDAEILWVDEVGVQADHHPGRGYARIGEPATIETPPPHIRVNQISAISNEGAVRFMVYNGSLDAAVFLVFMGKLIVEASRKIYSIADNLPAHKTPAVRAWLEEHRDRIAIYYLPTYSPQLNPVEYLNNDMKSQVNKEGLAPDRPTLQARLSSFMKRLTRLPDRVISYFMHSQVQYAAPAELL